jgi:hypothetical protein
VAFRAVLILLYCAFQKNTLSHIWLLSKSSSVRLVAELSGSAKAAHMHPCMENQIGVSTIAGRDASFSDGAPTAPSVPSWFSPRSSAHSEELQTTTSTLKPDRVWTHGAGATVNTRMCEILASRRA